MKLTQEIPSRWARSRRYSRQVDNCDCLAVKYPETHLAPIQPPPGLYNKEGNILASICYTFCPIYLELI